VLPQTTMLTDGITLSSMWLTDAFELTKAVQESLPQLALAWFRAFKSRRHDGYVTDPMVWQRLHTGDKILVIIGVLIITGIALTILLTAIPNLLETWKSG
jgi:hypothetical protein